MESKLEKIATIKSVFRLTDELAAKVVELRDSDYINTEKGYRMGYEIIRDVVDQKLDQTITCEIPVYFSWSGPFPEKFEEYAREEGREDLIEFFNSPVYL